MSAQPSSSRNASASVASLPQLPLQDTDAVKEMYRLVGNATRAFVPVTRKRREESSDQRKARKELKYRLDDECYDIVEIKASTPQTRSVQDERLVDLIRTKLSRLAVDGGHGSSVRLSNLVARLQNLPSDQQLRNLSGVLDLFERLSFTAGNVGSEAMPEPLTSTRPPPSSRRESRSTANQVPAAAAAESPQLASASNTNHRTTYAIPTDHLPTTSSPSLPPPPSSKQDRPFKRPLQQVVPPQNQATATPNLSNPAKVDPVAPPITIHPIPADSLQKDGPVSKKELLHRWRKQLDREQISEQDLLRDVIFILQGINGRIVKFQEEYQLPNVEPGEPAQVATPNKILRIVFDQQQHENIDAPTKTTIHRLAELGRLYRRVSDFSQEKANVPTSGLIMQSLCHFISNELAGFYRLIASLEAQMKHSNLTYSAAAATTVDAQPSTYVTLKRLSVWTEEMTLRFRLMSTIIESCQDAHGGALVSLIHSYTFNGDPFIRKFTSLLLDQVSKPFFHSLSQWIYQGELHDPFQDFFVEQNTEPPSAAAVASTSNGEELPSFVDMENDVASLWQHKFVFRKQMLPSFLDESFGRKIFSTGKSLNFIRHSCGDGDWVATQHKSGDSGKQLRYTDLSGLERTIDTAFTSASKRLLDIFLDNFKLLEHLRALKDYLMLSRGDFVDLLMQSLGSSLNRPASSLFRHNLTASLETAVRGSNAQYDDPDILRRLDARILEFNTGDTGWDTFTLEYKVDSPVNTVLDTQAMIGYQTIFSHLWKIKRVENALNSSWIRLVSCSNALRRIRGKDAIGRELDRDSHKALVMLGEMIHFVRQMQGFCQLEVIEYSWDDLQNFFSRRRGDLDELIQSHRAYLNALIGKVLLRGGKRGSSQDYLAGELRCQFDTILTFTVATDDLSHYITRELARYDIELDSRRPTTAARGTLPSQPQIKPATLATLPPPDATAVATINQRLREQSVIFQERMHVIIGSLEKHANLTVRDLGSRLNFNVHYEGGRPSQHHHHGGRSRRETMTHHAIHSATGGSSSSSTTVAKTNEAASTPVSATT